jgi:hypothetical protein
MELAETLLWNFETFSHRFGDGPHWIVALCHHWERVGSMPKRSRYAGSFELENGTLEVPVLLLSYVLVLHWRGIELIKICFKGTRMTQLLPWHTR